MLLENNIFWKQFFSFKFIFWEKRKRRFKKINYFIETNLDVQYFDDYNFCLIWILILTFLFREAIKYFSHQFDPCFFGFCSLNNLKSLLCC